MENTTILLLIFGFFLSLLIAFFQYYFKEKNRVKIVKYLFTLRTLAIYLLFVALINPYLIFESFIVEKPTLNILIDNSKSIEYLNQKQNLVSFYKALIDDKRLNDKFEVKTFQFSNEFNYLDTLSFSDSQTNIYNALIETEKINSSKLNKATILLSDGNQTVGIDYKNHTHKAPVFPIVFGDTLSFEDLWISQVNVNRYTYVNNEFPVEVFISSNSSQQITSTVSVKSEGKTLSRKKVLINPNSSRKIEFNLKSSQKGVLFYSIEISPLKNEKNTTNNLKRISIEAIDEKSKLLLVSSVLHPDIGSLKRGIESNKKRNIEIINPDEFTTIDNYQSIILYQPNPDFKKCIESIKKNNKSIFIITGKQTDYTFLNAQDFGFRKNAINDIEKTSPIFQADYLPFQQDNIGFDQFSPVTDVFGEVIFSKDHDVLLKQRINGIETNQPLLATLKNSNQKIAVLFGEGIWQWRASSFLKENSFQSFDRFLNSVIQYTTNTTYLNRLEVEVEPIHYSNQPIVFTSYFFDENFKFDKNAQLEIEIKKQMSNNQYILPFSNQENKYLLEVDNIEDGTYIYTVKEKRSNVFKSGKFEVVKADIESQFVNANYKDLITLAKQSNGKVYYSSQANKLISSLLENPSFKSIQKATQQRKSILDWWQYLFLTLVLFSFEWFLRKYHGKI